jgi:O-acetylhomoserine/O-acetylserine sulfhydrylase-like pyridoxal-dependent enzyme
LITVLQRLIATTNQMGSAFSGAFCYKVDGRPRTSFIGVTVGDPELIQKIYLFSRLTGPSLSPFNAWVLSKSLETLAIRLDRHCENALKVAEF